MKDVKECDNVLISRSSLPSEQNQRDNLKCEVVGFSDGSNVGFASVVYLRWRNQNESIVDVKFLGAKARVASIRGNTIPRNELCETLILARLTWSTVEYIGKTEISDYLSHSELKLLCDSTTVLSWIQSSPIKYKPYVKNKAIEIQTTLPALNWKYIPSSKNEADLLSRGCTKAGLDIIIKGPDILKIPVSEWLKHPKREDNHGGRGGGSKKRRCSYKF